MASSSEWINFREKVFIVLKRKWVLITFLVVVMTVVAVTTFTATPLYRASSRIIIEPRLPKVMPFEELYTIGGRQLDYYNTQYKILTSYSLASKVAEELIARKVAHKLTRRQVESLNPEALLTMVKIKPIAQSYMVDIQVIGPDPVLSALIANTWAEQYIRLEINAKLEATKQVLGQLARNLREQSLRVQVAQRELQDYKEQEGIVSAENRQSIMERDLAELSSLYLKARQERMNKEHELVQLDKYRIGDQSFEALPVIMRNPIIQRLKSHLVSLQGSYSEYSQRYKAEHPKMQQLQAEISSLQDNLTREIGKIVEGVRKEYEIAHSNETKILEELEALKVRALDAERKNITYSALEDQVISSRKIYEALLERVNEASMSGQIEVTNARILDRAKVPVSPFQPRKGFNLAIGLLVGILGGIGLIFLLENLDDTIKNTADVKSHLRLPLLGAIPIYEQIDSQGFSSLPVIDKPMGVIAESFRTIRTGIQFSSEEKPSRLLLVTSSMPGEGKTDIASQLALIFAQSEEKVLLIDSDLRKPRLSSLFSELRGGPGLSEYLQGEAGLEDIFYSPGIANLTIVPGGHPPKNPAELLNTSRFGELLEHVRSRWQRILLDSPPLVSVTDAAILGRFSDGVIYVVRAGSVSWKKALNGRDHLAAVQADILGVILNAVDLNRSEYYYYYRSYYK